MADILPLARDPRQRLEAALRLLAVAQEGQREAVRQFREQLFELRDASWQLQASLQGFQREIHRTAEAVQGTREAVRGLERRAAATG